MDAAKSRLGTNIFDPRSDLGGSPKKIVSLKKEITTLPDKPSVTPQLEQLNSATEQVTFNESPILRQEPVTIIEPQKAEAVQTKTTKQAKTRETKDDATNLSRKVRFGANVALTVKERVDNAAYWIPGMTLSRITEDALEKEVKRLEREFNNGQPFEQMGDFRFGRPRSKSAD